MHNGIISDFKGAQSPSVTQRVPPHPLADEPLGGRLEVGLSSHLWEPLPYGRYIQRKGEFMYKVIVFDIGDTLIGYEPDAKTVITRRFDRIGIQISDQEKNQSS